MVRFRNKEERMLDAFEKTQSKKFKTKKELKSSFNKFFNTYLNTSEYV